MSVKWLTHPRDGRKLSFEEAPRVLEEDGVMPAAAVRWLCEDRPRSAYLSPSQLDPDSTCRREAVIERLFDYGMDPRDKWNADEGTTWHEGFAARAGGEAEIPNEEDRGKPGVVECPDGKLRIEVYPGILMRGYIDQPGDWAEIHDYKTKKYPKVYGGKNSKAPVDYREKDKEGYEFQMNAYGDMAEHLGRTPKVEHLTVWSMYRGSHDKTRTWLKLAIRRIPNKGLWPRISGWATEFVGWLRRTEGVKTEAEKLALLAEVPMDGMDKQMFNGTKCTLYCPVADICKKHAEGWVSF